LLHNLDRETVPTISALRRFHNASFSHFLKLTMPVNRQSQEPLLVGMCGVSPTEGDVALLEGDESAVGDGDAVGVATEIAQRVFRSAEGRLGIDYPVVAEQGSEPCGEASWFRQWREVTVELELVVVEGVLEAGDDLAAKDATEHLHRQEERMTRRDPAHVIGSEAASGGHAVDMGMMYGAR
jgi:hypothetical protein